MIAAAIAATVATPTSSMSFDRTVSTQERVLPLRGERLLEVLKKPVPALKSLSISPDGSFAIHIEVVARPGPTHLMARLYPSTWATDAVSASIIATDTRSGQRFSFPDASTLLRSVLRVRGVVKTQWSHDNKTVALLSVRPDGVHLSTWTPAAPLSGVTSVHLSDLSDRIQKGATIADWAWFPERAEVVVGVLGPLPPAGREDSANDVLNANRLSGFSWFLSTFDIARERAVQALAANRHRTLTLHVVDLRSQRSYPLDTGVPFDRNRDDWVVKRDGLGILIPTADARLSSNRQVLQYQLRLLSSGSPEGKEFREARSRVYSIDVARRSVEEIYRGGPGPITALAELRDSASIVAIENDPSLAVWPTAGVFGMIRQFDANRTRTIFPEPVPLPSVIQATDRRGFVYHHDGGSPERRLYEVAVATGVRTLLSPKELSVTECVVSADGRMILAVLENVNTPPELYVWSTSVRRWRRLTENLKSIADEELGAIDRVTWRSKDDRFDIDGFLVKPSNFTSNRRYPLLVWLHGGTGGSVANEFDLMFGVGGFPARVFAEEGYLVLIPTWRGDRGKTVEFSRALLGNAHTAYDYDIDAGVDAMVERGLADREKIGILAHSAGGMFLSYALTHSTRYKAAVNNDAPGLLPEIQVPENATWTAVPHGAPVIPEATQVLQGFDPMDRTWADPDKIRTPLLVRWSNLAAPPVGDEAANVYGLRWEFRFHALPQSKRLDYVLKRNHVPFEVIIDRDEHWLVNYKYILEYQSRVLQWFDHFILEKGESPLPAMKSPLDYGEQSVHRR